MYLYKAILLFGISIISLVSHGQTVTDVQKMESEYQKRLDTGADMLNDTKRFYFKMDSSLNVVYWKLYKSSLPTKRLKVKSSQLQWLKMRHNYFKEEERKFLAKYKSGEWGTDMEMITWNSKAMFVQKRVIFIIRKLP